MLYIDTFSINCYKCKFYCKTHMILRSKEVLSWVWLLFCPLSWRFRFGLWLMFNFGLAFPVRFLAISNFWFIWFWSGSGSFPALRYETPFVYLHHGAWEFLFFTFIHNYYFTVFLRAAANRGESEFISHCNVHDITAQLRVVGCVCGVNLEELMYVFFLCYSRCNL